MFRGEPLRSGAKKSWLDSEAILPSGRLTHFYVYVGRNVSAPVGETYVGLFLQIWRPIPGIRYEYTLVFSNHVEVDVSDLRQGYLYRVSTEIKNIISCNLNVASNCHFYVLF